MSTESYENVIIGSGEGGKYLAWHLAQSGQRTVVVERSWVAVPARMSIAFPARTRSIVPRLRISLITQLNLGFRLAAVHLTWRLFDNENGRWLKA